MMWKTNKLSTLKILDKIEKELVINIFNSIIKNINY